MRRVGAVKYDTVSDVSLVNMRCFSRGMCFDGWLSTRRIVTVKTRPGLKRKIATNHFFPAVRRGISGRSVPHPGPVTMSGIKT